MRSVRRTETEYMYSETGGGKDFLNTQVLSSEWNSEKVTEGDSSV